jgi:outer membrane murein-binding lipoprotein Lpp
MNLFRSKFAKLEAMVAKKADERTADDLSAAQAEMDTNNAGVILVPKSDTIKSASDLQAHIDGLEKQVKEAKASEATAKAEAEKATKALTDLRGTRVLDDARETTDKGKGGDKTGEPTEEEKREAQVHSTDYSWNKKAEAMGIGEPVPQNDNK